MRWPSKNQTALHNPYVPQTEKPSNLSGGDKHSVRNYVADGEHNVQTHCCFQLVVGGQYLFGLAVGVAHWRRLLTYGAILRRARKNWKTEIQNTDSKNLSPFPASLTSRFSATLANLVAGKS